VTHEQQIVALREEVRRAGEQTSILRWRWFWRSASLLALAGVVTFALAALSPGLGVLALFALLAAPFGILIVICTFPGVLVWRWGKQQLLSDRLARIPKTELSAILVPLRQDEISDTRAIAAALIRELGVPQEDAPRRELTPAAPEARGDEASPAERER
jgi:hypothetical protein